MNRAARETVVILGASAGVGRAVARRFGEDGSQVALVAREGDRLEAAAREIDAAGGRALTVQADVADPDAVEAAAARAEDELGPIDVWINNAMVTVYASVLDTEPEEFRRATEVTYLGSVWGTMAALRRMVPRDRGTIVQVGSALAYRGIPLQAAYCGAKHGLQGFIDSLRAELFHEGSNVHVTMVQLPALNTPQFSWARTKLPRKPQPVPPIFQPEVAAEAIVWAARNRRRELHVGWPTVKTVYGNKFAPALGDLYLGETGVESQLRDDPIEPDRTDNLFQPVRGNFGARGEFDDRAKPRSWQLWATLHRRALGLAAAGGALAALALARRDGGGRWRRMG